MAPGHVASRMMHPLSVAVFPLAIPARLGPLRGEVPAQPVGLA
jgi:hypothetical protein